MSTLIERPLTRIILEIDPIPYDDSYIDMLEDATEEEKQKARTNLCHSIESEGVYGLVLEVRHSPHSEWQHHDSLWSIIGDSIDYHLDEFKEIASDWEQRHAGVYLG